MSDILHIPSNPNTLAQRLQSAEKSIGFIQREHASTLVNLHEEISKWQQKCSDLTFRLAIGGANIINSVDDSKLRSKIEHLENEIHQRQETITKFNKILEEKEKSIHEYQNRLIVNERKHEVDLRLENDKQRQLRLELEQRSTLIAQLTNQLHRERQLQKSLQNRTPLEQVILPNKPQKVPTLDERSSTNRLSNRSASLSNRASPNQDLTNGLLSKRRPPTPPQQLRPLSSKITPPNEEQLFAKRQCQLLDEHPENVNSNKITSTRSPIKVSQILPPIVHRKMPLKALATGPFQQQGEV